MTTLINETCPAAVSTVTLVQNQFLIDGDETNWVNSVLEPTETTPGSGAFNKLTLSGVPVTNTLKVFKNGQLLTLTTDYTHDWSVVTLVIPKATGDVYTVAFLAQPA